MPGKLVIISSPSGGGKDTVIRGLVKKIPQSIKFVTTTTRAMRPGEKEGVDYHYISRDQFEEMIKNDAFVEYNNYTENYYGTENKRLLDLLSKYQVVFSSIEVHGKNNVDLHNWQNLSIFLLPESLEKLRKRITHRGGLTEEIMTKRLKTAEIEIKEADSYDHKIINYQGKIEETEEKILTILKNELGLDKNPNLN